MLFTLLGLLTAILWRKTHRVESIRASLMILIDHLCRPLKVRDCTCAVHDVDAHLRYNLFIGGCACPLIELDLRRAITPIVVQVFIVDNCLYLRLTLSVVNAIHVMIALMVVPVMILVTRFPFLLKVYLG